MSEGYSNKFGVRVYALVNYLTATLSWFLFFCYRKWIELGSDNFDLTHIFSDQNLYVGIAIIPLGWMFLYFLLEQSSDIYRLSRISTFIRTSGITVLGSLILLFTILIDDVFLQHDTYLTSFIVLFGIHFVITAFGRIAIIGLFKSWIRKGHVQYDTLLLGSELEINNWKSILSNKKAYLGYGVKGGLTSSDNYNELYSVLQNAEYREVIVTDHLIDNKAMDSIVETSSQFDESLSLKIIPELYDKISGRFKVRNVYDLPLMKLEQNESMRWESAVKQIMDVVVSVLALVLLLPFIIFVAIRVKLSSPGSILFTQERVGRNGKKFMIYKFRSMYQDAEDKGPQLSHDEDERCTRWGAIMRKWRIDEIPQFINVLKGEMSLVGPRPERQYYVDQIMKTEPRIRRLYKVHPGITSLGQVKYGYASTLEEMHKRLKFDLIYLENRSIVLDAKILFYTLIVLLQGKGK